MARILLVDCDNKYPNLALMKLSAWHKTLGDEIFFNFPLCCPDMTYASCVFPKNRFVYKTLAHTPIQIGGSGCDEPEYRNRALPPHIEHIMPDYDLYNCQYSLGFTSRGCIRNCDWCIVPAKEGRGVKDNATIYEFWNKKHKEIMILDNNILASPKFNNTIEDIVKENLSVDFNAGLDIRLVNEDNAKQLARLKTFKQFHFAFDDLKYEMQYLLGIDILSRKGVSPRRILTYILCGFDSNWRNDFKRLKIANDLHTDPYIMIFEDNTGLQHNNTWERCPMEIRNWLEVNYNNYNGNVLLTVASMVNGMVYRKIKDEFLTYVEYIIKEGVKDV